MPSRYPNEGITGGYRCPRCGSSDIICTLAMYEFSTLECEACSYSDTVDDWQIDEWFAPGDD